MSISAVILTKNEERNIVNCIEDLSWCDEIIILDDCSQDRSIELVENLKNPKIKIIKRKLEDFSTQRNLALEKAKNDWVLFVDADEKLDKELTKEILNLDSQTLNQYNGFYIKRKDLIWNKELKYGECGQMKLVRLARKDKGIWRGKVHEFWEIKGNTKLINGCIIHTPHPTVREFLQEINYYSTLRAEELFESQIKVKSVDIIFYPLVKFILNYMFKSGFRDGIEGLIFALLMSFHSYLVRAKLWLLWRES